MSDCIQLQKEHWEEESTEGEETTSIGMRLQCIIVGSSSPNYDRDVCWVSQELHDREGKRFPRPVRWQSRPHAKVGDNDERDVDASAYPDSIMKSNRSMDEFVENYGMDGGSEG